MGVGVGVGLCEGIAAAGVDTQWRGSRRQWGEVGQTVEKSS